MAQLIPSEQQNSSLPITLFDNPASLTLIPFLCQRFSEGPACRILYFLDGSTLLNLRLVSKMTDEEHKTIKELIGSKIRFVVDGSEECNAGMITSYLNFKWQSLVFPETLDSENSYLALQSAHFLLALHKAHIPEFTIKTSDVYSNGLQNVRRILEPIFKQLEFLRVNISGGDLNALSVVFSHCESLRRLDLKGYLGINHMILGLDQAKLETIFGKVEVLNLSETQITTPVLRRLLAACASLKSLNLHECAHISGALNQMTEEQIQKAFGRIDDLDLGETLITEKALLQIAASKPPLRALSLYDCKNVSGFYGYEDILKNLRSLNLGCTDIKWRPLLNILAACQNLEQLFLTGCEAISKVIESFTPEDNLPQVVQGLEIVLLPNTNITEKALSTFLKSCQSLRYLDVSACNAFPAVVASMTDEELWLTFHHLWNLDVSDVPDFPVKDFERLLAQLKGLQILNLEGTKWITAFVNAFDDEALGKLFADLKGIFLSGSDISKEALYKLLRACKALKAVKILGVSSFSDLIADLDEESIHALLEPIAKIVVREEDLSKGSLAKLLKVLPRLEEKLW